MIKLHPVEAALLVSIASFIVFVGFSTSVNYVSSSYEHRIEQVREEEGHARRQLKKTRRHLQGQRRRADSLEVIAEATRRKELLWTARAIYSETKRPHEMRYVGWVVRNRFDTGFRGADTYRDVVLTPKQFSAFNRGNPLRKFYIRLEPKHVGQIPRWHAALSVAKQIIDSPSENRPFPVSTLFFYSERSLNSSPPRWSLVHSEIQLANIEDDRFRFFQKTSLASNEQSRHEPQPASPTRSTRSIRRAQ